MAQEFWSAVLIREQINLFQSAMSSAASHPAAGLLLGAGTSVHGPPLTE
jgi:hypothetical protein